MTSKRRFTTIEISKEDLKFSCAHFTIFSPAGRERLHGHNFRVRAEVTAPVDDNGMCFNYQEIKSRLRKICHSLDEYVILPNKSPQLLINNDNTNYHIHFNDDRISLPISDVLLLPICNTTVEELSFYILDTLVSADQFFIDNEVKQLIIKVSSGDGQWGSSLWQPSG